MFGSLLPVGMIVVVAGIFLFSSADFDPADHAEMIFIILGFGCFLCGVAVGSVQERIQAIRQKRNSEQKSD